MKKRKADISLRIVLSGLGTLASLIMLIASGAMNYLFLSSLGKSPIEAQVLGAVSTSADLLKALLPFFIAWGWREGKVSIVLPGLMIWGLFTGFSFLSAIGFSAQNRGVKLEAHTTLKKRYNGLQNDLKSNQVRLRQLPRWRPIDVIKNDILAFQQNSRWPATKGCKDVTLHISRTYCQRYFQLRSELAASRETKKLVKHIEHLKLQINQFKTSGVGLDGDPQVSMLSRISGYKQDHIRLVLTLIIALLVELGSSLGLYLSTGHRINHRDRNTQKPKVTVQTVVSIGAIEDFCLDCLKHDPQNGLSLETLFSAYICWCQREGYEPLVKHEFAEKFHDLSQDIGIPLIDGNYQEIGLVGAGTDLVPLQ